LPTNHVPQQYPTVHVVAHPCCPLLVQEPVSISATQFPNACLPRMQRQPDTAPTCPAPTSERTAERTCLKAANHFPFPSFQGQLAAGLPCQTGHGLNYCYHATLISEGGTKSYHIHLLPSAPTPLIAIRILVSRTHLPQEG
jgi:hypothetical protein